MSTAIRISNDLFDSAKKHAEKQHRSTQKQIEYWASLGMAAEDNPDLPLEFIISSLAGIEAADRGEVTEFTL